MLPYAAYKYVQKKRQENQRDMDDALDSLTSNLSRSLIPDTVALRIPDVSARLCDDGRPTDQIPGYLSIVEKIQGVFIEWTPKEDDSGWVLTGENDESLCRSPMASPGAPEKSAVDYSKFSISLDIHEISSFRNIEPKRGSRDSPRLEFICKDGSAVLPLLFTKESPSAFLDVLQRYLTLRRSHKEPNLVLVVNEKAEALAKSVTMLDQNGDILTRLMTNPYATALTGLGKITSFMQDQVIPALLDSDEVSQEEKIRAMRELRLKDEDGSGLRVHSDVEFEVVTQLDLPPRPDIFREKPIDQALWDSFKLPDGTLDPQKLHHLKMNIFRGGIVPELRKEAWKYLLGYREWNEKASDFEKRRGRLAKEYNTMRNQWQSISQEQEDRFFHYSKRKGLVEKDVARTDRTMTFFQGDENNNLKMLHNMLMTYVMYNFDLGYVQGMSDFASPLLFIMENEMDAFWCFVKLMERIHRNFEKDQAFIKLQMNQLRDMVMIVNPALANYLESHQSDDMYFCFRWVLVWFKREFTFLDTCKLWEVIWTNQPCPNFLLLICVAILDRESNTIIANKFGLTEILKHVNDLSMRLDLDDVLTSAEAIFHQLSASQDKLPRHICEYLNLGEAASTSSGSSSPK